MLVVVSLLTRLCEGFNLTVKLYTIANMHRINIRYRFRFWVLVFDDFYMFIFLILSRASLDNKFYKKEKTGCN